MSMNRADRRRRAYLERRDIDIGEEFVLTLTHKGKQTFGIPSIHDVLPEPVDDAEQKEK